MSDSSSGNFRISGYVCGTAGSIISLVEDNSTIWSYNVNADWTILEDLQKASFIPSDISYENISNVKLKITGNVYVEGLRIDIEDEYIYTILGGTKNWFVKALNKEGKSSLGIAQIIDKMSYNMGYFVTSTPYKVKIIHSYPLKECKMNGSPVADNFCHTIGNYGGQVEETYIQGTIGDELSKTQKDNLFEFLDNIEVNKKENPLGIAYVCIAYQVNSQTYIKTYRMNLDSKILTDFSVTPISVSSINSSNHTFTYSGNTFNFIEGDLVSYNGQLSGYLYNQITPFKGLNESCPAIEAAIAEYNTNATSKDKFLCGYVDVDEPAVYGFILERTDGSYMPRLNIEVSQVVDPTAISATGTLIAVPLTAEYEIDSEVAQPIVINLSPNSWNNNSLNIETQYPYYRPYIGFVSDDSTFIINKIGEEEGNTIFENGRIVDSNYRIRPGKIIGDHLIYIAQPSDLKLAEGDYDDIASIEIPNYDDVSFTGPVPEESNIVEETVVYTDGDTTFEVDPYDDPYDDDPYGY